MIKHITILITGAAIAIAGFSQQSATPTNIDIPPINKRAINKVDRKTLSLTANETVHQKLDSIIEFNFNETTGEWNKKFRKESYAYDAAFNDTLFLLSSWNNKKNQWVNLWKETTTYDEQNKITGYTAYTQDIEQSWSPFNKEEYSYNNKEEITETLFYTWKYAQKKWLLIEKTIHTYDSNSNLIADTLYIKYTDDDDWVLDKKVEHEYVNNSLNSIISYTRDKDANEWVFDERTIMAYNFSDILLGIHYYTWNEKYEQWNYKEIKGYGYDDDYNMTSYTKVTLGDENKILSGNYEHDYTVARESLILPEVLVENDRMAFHHKITGKQLSQQNKETEENEKYREVTFYYSPVEISTAINSKAWESVVVFPNPVKESFHINLPGCDYPVSLTVFDVNGKKILSKNIMSGESIDVSSIKSGIYFYSITLNKESITGKFVKTGL